jgi:hypothetical protein
MDVPAISQGAIIAASIAAAVSLVGLLITKDLKTTEFRQHWIDKLRDDIAEFTSFHAMIKYHIQLNGGKEKDTKEFKQETFKLFKTEIIEMERVYTSILLRLNPKEHIKIIKKLDELKASYNSEAMLSVKIMDTLEDELLALFQADLKKEWKRVKSGELSFRIAKYSAVIILFFGLYVFIRSI